MLYIFGGLPGTGKTTISRALARRIRGVWLRVDTVEQELIRLGTPRAEIGGVGYALCQKIAADNLRNGLHVVADSVNPIALTRRAWREVARSANIAFIEIEIVCSDTAEHRRRVTERQPDIAGHHLPTWDDVMRREYEPWPDARLRIDSATSTPADAVQLILSVPPLPSRGSE